MRTLPVPQPPMPQQSLRRVRVRCSLPVPDAPRGCVRRVRRSAGLVQMRPRRVPELRVLQPSVPLPVQPG